jgi:hypothetical protein
MIFHQNNVLIFVVAWHNFAIALGVPLHQVICDEVFITK